MGREGVRRENGEDFKHSMLLHLLPKVGASSIKTLERIPKMSPLAAVDAAKQLIFFIPSSTLL